MHRSSSAHAAQHLSRHPLCQVPTLTAPSTILQSNLERMEHVSAVSLWLTQSPRPKFPTPSADCSQNRFSQTQAGACFGMSAAACRTGFLLAARVSWTAAPAGLAASICLSSTGFALQTLGFKDGNTVVVCTCAAVSSMVTGASQDQPNRTQTGLCGK